MTQNDEDSDVCTDSIRRSVSLVVGTKGGWWRGRGKRRASGGGGGGRGSYFATHIYLPQESINSQQKQKFLDIFLIIKTLHGIGLPSRYKYL